MSRLSYDKKSEIIAISLLALGVLLFFSLLPQWIIEHVMIQNSNIGDLNCVGFAGRLINESLKDLVGILSYFIPFIIILWGWGFFWGKKLYEYFWISIEILVPGLCLSILLGLVQLDSENVYFDFCAGVVGNWIATALQSALGTIGSYLVTAFSFLLIFSIFSDMSLRLLIRKALKAISLIFKLVMPAVSRKKLSAIKPQKARDVLRNIPLTISKDVPNSEPIGENHWEDKNLDEKPNSDFENLFSEGEGFLKKEYQQESSCDIQAPAETLSGCNLFSGFNYENIQYQLPPIGLLDYPDKRGEIVSDEELQSMGKILLKKLSDFNVKGELENIIRGPQISTFEIRPADGVKISKFVSLADDLAMASHVEKARVQAPLPGKGVVGIEIPNPERIFVSAREVLESPSFIKDTLILSVGLGKNTEGFIQVADLTRMPHLLIAGTTGSGKSVCINMIIASLLFFFGPDNLRLLMIDPKRIELDVYNGIPHLLHPVVSDSRETVAILEWAVAEMNRRYRLLSRNKARNIEDYNIKFDSGTPVKPLNSGQHNSAERVPYAERMPYVVILIDELSDLMCSEVKIEIEALLIRLAQMARAVGIHLVVATQRPSVDVITGLIKSNFPSRMSFQVSQKIDSRIILDINGAEQLLGKGDMLFIPADRTEPIRIQGAYISSEEIERLVNHWRSQKELLNAEQDGREVVELIAGKANNKISHASGHLYSRY